ncbi:tetraspanin-32 isoform X1 [Rousettus aegyptiacus]|uniref:Tetraspanin n=1 Tax=Rousettus aegyptiacus TaxID=9407 RepID=A0A7J8H8S6_ROUAE|nr:tetraspanin-32 isoform X1 [Rousettus aegyptiacus]KAF6468470.1 tetraspanin 32 [Rousettus aegyptiacus]
MGSWSRVRAAKCQMLATSCFVLLLGLCVATATLLTHFGAHFAVVSRVSPEGSPYKALHHWAFYAGIGLAGLLTLGAALSATATVREAGGLMAGGFLCFALAFCALVQVAVWGVHSPSQVEDAMLDVYDLVYDQAVKGRSGARWQELVAIQDTFRCCGKNGPSSLLGSGQAELCRGEEAVRQDCLRAIGSFLRTHRHVTSALTGAGLAAMVYAMLLSSFLWLAIHEGRSLHRKGAYALSPRAHGGRPQEPSFFRRFEDTHAPPPLSEEDALNDRLGPSRHLGGRRPLQDS